MNGKHWLQYTVLFFAAAFAVFAGSPLVAQTSEPAAAPIEEITVKGRRELRHLRAGVRKAREDLYSLINEHIDDPKFHVTCRFERRPMDPLDPRASTRIKERVCRSGYMRDELQTVAYFFMRGVVHDATPRLWNNASVYGEKVAEAFNENPELTDALQRFHRLQAEYSEALDARSGNE